MMEAMTNQDCSMPDARQWIVERLGVGVPFLCSLATVSAEGAPRVRFVWAKLGPDLSLWIPTFEGTLKVTHIEADPRVHATCGDTSSNAPGSYFQIEGVAKISREAEDRELCWTDRLSKWFDDPNDPRYAVVKIQPTTITVLPIGRQGPAQRWIGEDVA